MNSRDRRKLTTLGNESPNLKIMTYDDVYENARAVVENLLGLFGAEPKMNKCNL